MRTGRSRPIPEKIRWKIEASCSAGSVEVIRGWSTP